MADFPSDQLYRFTGWHMVRTELELTEQNANRHPEIAECSTECNVTGSSPAANNKSNLP